jgi:hypothetical protein
MLYKFKSKATGDVIMLGANGDQVMRIIGKEPAAQGIIAVADMPAAIAALQAAVVQSEAKHEPADDASAPAGTTPGADRVSLRQRVWPLVEMLKRAHGAGEPVVWGV